MLRTYQPTASEREWLPLTEERFSREDVRKAEQDSPTDRKFNMTGLRICLPYSMLFGGLSLKRHFFVSEVFGEAECNL